MKLNIQRRVPLLFLLFGLTLAACGAKSPAPSTAPPAAAPAPPLVDVIEVGTERLVDAVEAVGTIDAAEKVSVKPEIAGRIVRIAFDEGRTVQRGDILVELDPGKMKQDVEVASAKFLNIRQTILQQREQLAAARAKIAEARAGIDHARHSIREMLARLDRADAVLERARQDHARTQSLFEKEFKTRDDLEKSASAVKQAEAARTESLAALAGVKADTADLDRHPAVLQAAAAMAAAHAAEQALIAALGPAAENVSGVDHHPEVQRALAEMNLAKEKLKDLTLLAPMNGILSERRVAVGDFVDKGALLFDLVDISSVKIAFKVPERYLGRIRTGQEAVARVAPYPQEAFSGSVYYIDPTVDAASRTALLKMRLQNPGHRLKPGLFANVQIVVGDFPRATVIPEEAVVPQGGDMFAYVIEANTARLRPIRTGLRSRGKVQILEGLTAGERVVVAGVQKLRDGAPVRVNEPETPQ
ncbi:efflux RND transporter periplasmic adaptor subunit [bacterium]|nr:efflux RND transporter periplasmic adaptor subunit [bacterium]